MVNIFHLVELLLYGCKILLPSLAVDEYAVNDDDEDEDAIWLCFCLKY